MNYQNQRVADVARILKERVTTISNKSEILKSTELKSLFDEIRTIPAGQRASFGKEVNELKRELLELISQNNIITSTPVQTIDVTAPYNYNVPTDKRPKLLTSDRGSIHPLMTELTIMLDIFYRMGYTAAESPEIDDEWHMFTSLNFTEGHPARDDYDTFILEQKDKKGQALVAPAHVSTIQNRLYKEFKPNLEKKRPIAVVYSGRSFRNEDVDSRHDHTFYQIEFCYIDRHINAGNLVATVKAWFSEYFKQEIKIKLQPFYFPFTEPSFEFAAGCIFCAGKGCIVCGHSGWIELGGCGMTGEAGAD